MIESLLKQFNIQVTEQRKAILQVLVRSKKPMTIEDIKKKLIREINTSTLYRSLSCLVDAGLVYQTDFREGVAYFEFQETDHHHHHIICTQCGKRDAIEICFSHEFPRVADQTGYRITNHIFEIFGVCKKCS